MEPQDRLERTQWDLFWVPSTFRIIDRPELAAISCDSGMPNRNVVLRTRAPDSQLPDVVQEVRAFHRNATSRWMVPDTFDTQALTRAIELAGYEPSSHFEARARHVEEADVASPSAFDIRRAQSIEELRVFWTVVNQAFGPPFLPSAEELSEQLRRCTGPTARVHQYVAYDKEDSPVSAGGLSLFSDLRFGLLFAGSTVPAKRGQGAYSAVLAARVSSARAHGMEFVGLYALQETSAPIVARLGFGKYGEMSYWQREPDLSPAG